MRVQTSLLIAALLSGGCTQRDEPQANIAKNEPAVANPESEAGPVTQPNLVENVAGTPSTPGPDLAVSACLIQDGEQLKLKPLKAIGTEPFWGARIEGRCVTYSTPENQAGTRVWTKYKAGSQGGTWTGNLGGKHFVLRTLRQPGCSDGMSDKRFPITVELTVNGESRHGCAEPVAE
jgi:uncharacterized membrane protein